MNLSTFADQDHGRECNAGRPRTTAAAAGSPDWTMTASDRDHCADGPLTLLAHATTPTHDGFTQRRRVGD
jgi:hypothetical protein